MTLPGTAVLLALLRGLVVGRDDIRERALTGPAAEVRNRRRRVQAALADANVSRRAP